MPRQVYSVVAAVLMVLTSALIILGANAPVLAGQCFDQPNREPTQGAHWYYHYDREKNRKCWHLEDTDARMAAPPRTDQSGAFAMPTISSVFSPFFRGGPIAPLASRPQDAAASGEPRIIQSDPTRPLRIEDIAQQQRDLPEERAEERYVAPLSPAQRKALFEEYLRWEEIQRNLGVLGMPARSP